MKTKSIYSNLFFLVHAIILFFAPISNVFAQGSNDCGVFYPAFWKIEVFLNNIFYLFLALIFWTISPIGILFFLSAKSLLSRKTSKLKRRAMWLLQIVSALIWLSAILLILIIYLDSIFFNVLKIGKDISGFILASGISFGIIMLMFTMLERKFETAAKQNDFEKKRRDKKEEKEKEDIKKKA